MDYVKLYGGGQTLRNVTVVGPRLSSLSQYPLWLLVHNFWENYIWRKIVLLPIFQSIVYEGRCLSTISISVWEVWRLCKSEEVGSPANLLLFDLPGHAIQTGNGETQLDGPFGTLSKYPFCLLLAMVVSSLSKCHPLESFLCLKTPSGTLCILNFFTLEWELGFWGERFWSINGTANNLPRGYRTVWKSSSPHGFQCLKPPCVCFTIPHRLALKQRYCHLCPPPSLCHLLWLRMTGTIG